MDDTLMSSLLYILCPLLEIFNSMILLSLCGVRSHIRIKTATLQTMQFAPLSKKEVIL